MAFPDPGPYEVPVRIVVDGAIERMASGGFVLYGQMEIGWRGFPPRWYPCRIECKGKADDYKIVSVTIT